MTLQLVRQIRGHWSTSETAPQWLADVVLDLSIFMPSILTTTFAANAVVLSGGGGVYFVGTGGAPESYGTASAAFVTQAGPFDGPIIGANAQGTIAANGPRVLHLVAASTDGQPVEISDVVLTIEGESGATSYEVIYWGLSHGYALDRAAGKVWLGSPGPKGWRWEAHAEATHQVVELLAVFKDKAEPEFAPVPAKLAHSFSSSTNQ